MKTRSMLGSWAVVVLAGIGLPGTPALAQLPLCNEELIAAHRSTAMAEGLCDDNAWGIVLSGSHAEIGTDTCVRSHEDQLGVATRCEDLIARSTAGTMAPVDVPFYEVDANLAIGKQILPTELAGYEGTERKPPIALLGLGGLAIVAAFVLIVTRLPLFK